jgi:hypothetical protein
VKNADRFLKDMKSIDPDIQDGDYEAAFTAAQQRVAKIDDLRWFGEIAVPGGGILGTYYADSRESMWFPLLRDHEAAKIITKNTLF